MTDIFKEASNALLNYRQADSDGIMVLTSREAIHVVLNEYMKLATESEQLRKERDELAAYIRQKHDVLEVPTEIFNLCIQNR